MMRKNKIVVHCSAKNEQKFGVLSCFWYDLRVLSNLLVYFVKCLSFIYHLSNEKYARFLSVGDQLLCFQIR